MILVFQNMIGVQIVLNQTEKCVKNVGIKIWLKMICLKIVTIVAEIIKETIIAGTVKEILIEKTYGFLKMKNN